MDLNSKIYIAGHRGLVGSAIHENLQKKGYTNIVTRTHEALDLTNQSEVIHFFETERPEYVFLAAAKVGGIRANNTYRADFIYENMMIQNNVIHQSYKHQVKKLLFLGSTCIYPKHANQPIKESYLLTDTLEYTNEPYAIAKIAGIKMCESYNLQYGTNFISAMPTNLYGVNDNFDLENAHVIPALIRKMHLAKLLSEQKHDDVLNDLKMNSIVDAKAYLSSFGVNDNSVEIWGTGKPKREFLWSKDLADACAFLMKNCDFEDTYSTDKKEVRNTHINIGTGVDIAIKNLAETIQEIVGFKGTLVFDATKPDGTQQKLTNVSKLKGLGWTYKTQLKEGLKLTYDWYRSNKES